MNICFYTHIMPDPYRGGVERVTFNLCKFFKSRGISVFYITNSGDEADCVIPQNLNIKEKSNYINEFLTKHHIDIVIDQYGVPFITHPGIDYSVKIIRCYHMNPFARHQIRSLFEVFQFNNLKYSLMNIAFAINTPRRKFINKRKYTKLLSARGIDKMVYLSDSYIDKVRRLYKAPSSLFAAIPNALEDALITPPICNCLNIRRLYGAVA